MPAYRTNSRSTALEVKTDGHLAPTLTLTSATPLAFTFPPAPAPFDSPSILGDYSVVPTKPTLRLQTPPMDRSPSPMSPASPASDTSPVFSSPASSVAGRSPVRSSDRSRSRSPAPRPLAKRRRSTAHDDDVPRPKKGDQAYIKRPENAFILFRRKCVEERLQEQEAAEAAHLAAVAAAAAAGEKVSPKPKRTRQADLSKTISAQWRGLSMEERAHWENMAKEKKREHERLHPDYVYRPQRKESKKPAAGAQPTNKKGKARADTDGGEGGSFEFTIPLNRHARSTSAETGFNAQTIRLPIVNVPLPPYAINSPRRASFADWSDTSSMMSTAFAPNYQLMQQQPMWTQMPGLQVPQYGNASQMVSPTDTTSPTSPYNGPFTPATPWGITYPEPSIMSDSPCRSPGASFVPAPEFSAPSVEASASYDQPPELCDMPWTFEFSGEFVPSGADFLLDADFDLSQIPAVTLDELREIDAGTHPLSGWQDLSHVDLSAPMPGSSSAISPVGSIMAGLNLSAPSAEVPGAGPRGQDPFSSGLYYDSMLSAGRY